MTNLKSSVTREDPTGGVAKISEAAEFLRVGRSFINSEMDAGRLRYCRFGSRCRRIPWDELRRYVQEHTSGEGAS